MNQFLDWVKANVFIVIFIALMIVAPVAMFFVAGSMNNSVRQQVSARGQQITKFDQLPTNLPDGQRVLVNEDLLRQYERMTSTLADDAAAVSKRALEFNRKNHKPVMSQVFPEPPFEMREVIPKRFHERLVTSYDALLTDAHAGMPPTLDSLAEQLQRMRNLFITQDLKKDLAANLEPDEELRLKKALTDQRLSMYRDEASRVGLYAARDALMVPAWDQTRIPSPAQMFNWQWQYWAIEDVLGAIKQANKDAQTVVQAPVKHVLGIIVHGLPNAGEGGSGSSGPAAPPGTSAFTGFGEGAGLAATPPPASEGMGGAGGEGMGAASAPPAGSNGSVARDYSASFTGLVSNPVFDVLEVDVGLVAETARLPEVLDALSRHNFMTITNLRVEPADAFAATEHGFYYGSEPVCTVWLRLETVWLREWTKPYMPNATRQALGIGPDAPTPPADPAAPAPAG